MFEIENESINRPKILNERTGRMVYDSEYNAMKRQEYYDRYEKKVADNEGLTQEQMRQQLYNKRTHSLNILGTVQVAEYFGFSRGIACDRMRRGIIPSFQKNGRWYTHSYIIDEIDTRGRELMGKGTFKNLLPDVVYKHDMQEPWRKSHPQKGSK